MSHVASVPKYHFNVKNESDIYVDNEGMNLPNLDAAYAEALRMARELITEVPEFGTCTFIQVTDRTGKTVLTVRFSEATGPLH